MNTSNNASSGYNPWSDRDRSVAGVQLNGSVAKLTQVAAERYALLQAVADLKSRPERKARRRLAWRRSRSAVTKPA